MFEVKIIRDTLVYKSFHPYLWIKTSYKCYTTDNVNTQCVKSVRIQSFSGPYFPAFGLIQNIVFGHFSSSDWKQSSGLRVICGKRSLDKYIQNLVKTLIVCSTGSSTWEDQSKLNAFFAVPLLCVVNVR